MHIEGIAAIVTGGASGLGGATARMLAAKGAKVAIFDRNADAGRPAAAEIGAQLFKVDVADEGSVAAGLDQAEAAHGMLAYWSTARASPPASRPSAASRCPTRWQNSAARSRSTWSDRS